MTRTLADLAHATRHTALSTAGWHMPPLPAGRTITLYICAPEWIAAEAARLFG